MLQTEIEKLWETLSPSTQKEVLQKFVETMKSQSSLATSKNMSESVKHSLESPETPNKGGSRKVLYYSKFFLTFRSTQSQTTLLSSVTIPILVKYIRIRLFPENSIL